MDHPDFIAYGSNKEMFIGLTNLLTGKYESAYNTMLVRVGSSLSCTLRTRSVYNPFNIQINDIVKFLVNIKLITYVYGIVQKA